RRGSHGAAHHDPRDRAVDGGDLHAELPRAARRVAGWRSRPAGRGRTHVRTRGASRREADARDRRTVAAVAGGGGAGVVVVLPGAAHEPAMNTRIRRDVTSRRARCFTLPPHTI